MKKFTLFLAVYSDAKTLWGEKSGSLVWKGQASCSVWKWQPCMLLFCSFHLTGKRIELAHSSHLPHPGRACRPRVHPVWCLELVKYIGLPCF